MATPNLNAIESEGYSLDEINRSELTIAFLSLRSAFRAWFSTYHCFLWRFDIADVTHPLPLPDGIREDPDQYARLIRQNNHSIEYYQAYSETILRFHHFFELLLKDILRHQHELLATDASSNPLILYQLLMGEKVDASQLQHQKSVEFSEALKRVVCLIDNKKIDLIRYGYLKEGAPILEKLNWFRNRLIHRGTFVLPYASLDEFIGKYLLPLVHTSLQLPEIVGKENLWKYQHPLHCEIDPIQELLSVFQTNPFDLKKIAFLKELGRAAYNDPIQKRGLRIDTGNRRRAETIAKLELEQGKANVYDVLTCPVCGCHSLIRFFDIDTENPDPEDPGRAWMKTTNVECYCCSFEITDEVPNASKVNLHPHIEDYWLVTELVDHSDSKDLIE